jgi:hypothetical protein
MTRSDLTISLMLMLLCTTVFCTGTGNQLPVPKLKKFSHSTTCVITIKLTAHSTSTIVAIATCVGFLFLSLVI